MYLVFRLLILSCLFTSVAKAQQWRELNPPKSIFNKEISAIATNAAGKVYAAGRFTNSKNEYIVVTLEGDGWVELGGATNTLHANNVITALTTDAAGNLYATGGFTDAQYKTKVSKWNGTTWTDLGMLNANGIAYAMTTDNKGNLYVAGGFENATGKGYVAKWNDTAWTELGAGVNGLQSNDYVYALTADNAGNIYAAGRFTNGSGKCYVAKWNGTSWSELGNLNATFAIYNLVTDAAGNVYAAGMFPNSEERSYVAKWDGTSWQELGTGVNALNANGAITTLRFDQQGRLYAAGTFTNIDGSCPMKRWNGTSWQGLFNVYSVYAQNPSINSFAFDAAGNIYAGGKFTNTAGDYCIQKWDGAALTQPGYLGEALNATNGLRQVVPDNFGNVYTFGNFEYAGGYNQVAKWNSKSWSPLGNGEPAWSNGVVSAVGTGNTGNVYVAGVYAEGFQYHFFLSKWDGSQWTRLQPQQDSLTSPRQPQAITVDKKGNVWLSGDFVYNGRIYGLAKWDGVNFHYLPGGKGTDALNIAVDSLGNVYSTGFFKYVAKTAPDGTTTPVGSEQAISDYLTGVSLDEEGNLYALGTFRQGQGKTVVVKWNGSSWTTLGNLSDEVYAHNINSMVAGRNGRVFVAGPYGLGNYAHWWNGTAWQELGKRNTQQGQFSTVSTVTIDKYGSIYGAGSSYRNGFDAVWKYGADLAQPAIGNLPANFTADAGATTIKLINLPDSAVITSRITLDGQRLSINADTTITIDISKLSIGTHQLKLTYANGVEELSKTQSFTIQPNAVTGLIDPDAPNQLINFYPNPFKTRLQISGLNSGKSYSIYITNAIGQQLLQTQIRNNTSIELPVPADKNGLYWISIYDEKRHRLLGTAPIIKQ